MLLAPAFALRSYLLLGTTAGFAPGIPLGNLDLPLNPSPYLDLTLQNPDQPPLSASFGTLGLTGTAIASFTLPPGGPPSLVGATVHHAYVVLDLTSAGEGTGQVQFVSNPVGVAIIP